MFSPEDYDEASRLAKDPAAGAIAVESMTNYWSTLKPQQLLELGFESKNPGANDLAQWAIRNIPKAAAMGMDAEKFGLTLMALGLSIAAGEQFRRENKVNGDGIEEIINRRRSALN